MPKTHPLLQADFVPDLRRRYTYDELCAVMDETTRPHELWNGQLVMDPAPGLEHQRIVLQFAVTLRRHVRKAHLGEVFVSPFDMVLSPDTCLQPDVAFVSSQNAFRTVGRALQGPADLVAEVVSASKRQRDLNQKLLRYEAHGVKEYWIIDPRDRVVELFGYSSQRRYRSLGRFGPEETAASRLLDGFRLKVAHLLEG